MANELSPSTIDPASGELRLMLVPYYLPKIHCEPITEELIGGVPIPKGMPFAIHRDSTPQMVALHGGMTPDELKDSPEFELGRHQDSISWWRWGAYAYFDFGWSCFPSPEFHSNRLTSITVARFGDNEAENYDQLVASFRKMLGEPLGAGQAPRGCLLLRNITRTHGRVTEWDFPWGRVHVRHEHPLHTAEASIHWSHHTNSHDEAEHASAATGSGAK